MAEYQRYAKDPSFQVQTPITRGDAATAKAEDNIRQQQSFYDSNRIVDQQRIENARYAGQDLQALAPFAESLVKQWEAIEKQSFKDRQIGEQYDSLFRLDLDLTPEQEALVLSAAENKYYGQTANDLEKAGLINEAEKVRANEMRLAKGVTNERALLYDARSRFASDITALVNSEQLSALYQADPSQALAVATKIWIENNNLQYTTKSNFVSILGETIRNTNTYMATNATTERIKAEKAQRLIENDRNAYNAVLDIKPTNAVDRFQQMSQAYLEDNNGIVTQSAANYRAAKTMLESAQELGPEFVNVVLEAQIRPGEEKSSLGETYPTLARTAKENAVKKGYDKILLARKENLIQLGKDLEKAKTEAERVKALDDALSRSKGDPEGRAAIQNNYAAYASTDEQFSALQQDLNALDSGVTKTPQQVAADVSSGRLSRAGAQKYMTALNQKTQEGKTAVTSVTKTQGNLFAVNLARATGMTIDPNSGLAIIGPPGLITRDNFNQIRQAYNLDLKSHLSRVMYTRLKFDGSQDAATQEGILQEESDKFYQDNVVKAGGKYNFDNLSQKGAYLQNTKAEDYALSKSQMESFGSSMTRRNAPAQAVVPDKDLGGQWGKDYTNLGEAYTPGDSVYTPDQTRNYLRTGINAGIQDRDLVRFAQQKGVTPLQLINDSAAAHREPPMTNMTKEKANDLFNPQSALVSSPEYKKGLYRAMPAFLAAGYTPQGAAAAIAAIYQLALKQKKPLFNIIDYVSEFEKRLSPTELLFYKSPRTTQRQLIPTLGMYPLPAGSWASDMNQITNSFFGQ
jgi:hypothetical protein